MSTRPRYQAVVFRVVRDLYGTVTRQLADSNNPPGYMQVLEEQNSSGVVQKSFLLGHDVIAQYDATHGLVYLLYDGHGGSRQLVNPSGVIVTPSGGIALVFS